MGVKDDFFQRGSLVVGDGTWTWFWEDAWLGDTPLAYQFPALYIVRTKDVSVAGVFSQVHLNMRINRLLIRKKWFAWVYLVSGLMNVHLNNEPESF
jgi:hypothetical protein